MNGSTRTASSSSDAQRADAEAAAEVGEATSYSSEAAENNGTLATDEALAALREKLAGR